MIDWIGPGTWSNALFWGAGCCLVSSTVFMGYGFLFPFKDYYVVERKFFDRLREQPWRSNFTDMYYHGFIDYLAAKAFFDMCEDIYGNDPYTESQGAEHALYMISARSKMTAVARLKADKAHTKELLHKTSYNDISARQRKWREMVEEEANLDAEAAHYFRAGKDVTP